jgi:hypothetical protein
MTHDEVIAELRAHIARNYITSLAYSESIGVTPAFISKVLKKERPITKAILDSIGIEKQVIYKAKAA